MQKEYQQEFRIAKWIEDIHHTKSAAISASIGILQEVITEVDENGELPSYTKGYLMDKMDTIRRLIK